MELYLLYVSTCFEASEVYRAISAPPQDLKE